MFVINPKQAAESWFICSLHGMFCVAKKHENPVD